MKEKPTKKMLRGFTLIELLIVIVIIGILATLVTANILGVRQRARDAQRKSDINQIRSSLELYRSDQQAYPLFLDLVGLCGGAWTANSTTYLQKVPCDPFSTGQYNYSYTGTGGGTGYTITACLENVNDGQKDQTNNIKVCTGGSTNWSYTVTNP